ncbi:MAG: hypothetical protein KQJ78_19530 [Deltaproteobacteria bacterium]|nr:hypothetical protein [Deltaproteobacteria bacterium]
MERKHPPRPGKTDAPVLAYAAELLYAALLNDGLIEGQEREHCERVLASSLRRFPNGYEMAKDLEHLLPSWDIGPEMVQTLDVRAWDCWDRAHKEALRLWVLAYDIKPAFSVGDVVDWMGDVGTVKSIDKTLGQYTIYLPEFVEQRPGYIGTIVDFEDVSAPAKQEVIHGNH